MKTQYLINILIAVGVMGGVGAVMATIIALIQKYFSVEEDPRIEGVNSILPGYNCGACGYPGCLGLAKALVEGKEAKVICRPASLEVKEAVVEYLLTTKDKEGNVIKVNV